MPRIALEPRFQVEHLSVLDSEGNLDTALEPKLSADELKSLYRLYGAEDNVMAKAYLQFGHNYNQVSREICVAFLRILP